MAQRNYMEGSKLSEAVLFYVSEDDKRALVELARARKASMSAVLRSLLRIAHKEIKAEK